MPVLKKLLKRGVFVRSNIYADLIALAGSS